MERRMAESRVTAPAAPGRYAYRAAGPGDADTINALLAETPVGGGFAISLERAPDPLAGDFGLSANHVIVLGHDRATGQPVGMCERTVIESFVNGAPVQLPYLGALRVTPTYRNRLHVIRDGFDAVRRLSERPGDAPFTFTSIAADNSAALRLLGKGLSGMPLYRPAGGYVTFVLRARPRRVDRSIRPATQADFPAIAALLNRCNARFHFAPVWTAQRIAALAASGLKPEHILVSGEGARLTGCIAAWDQSLRRQTIVRAYPPALARLRPLWNLAAPFTGLPALPPIGERLRQVALSHCAVADDDTHMFLALVDAALAQAAARGFDSGFIGLSEANPLTVILKRKRRAITYRTLLHSVHWQDQPEPRLDPSRPAQPEAALL